MPAAAGQRTVESGGQAGMAQARKCNRGPHMTAVGISLIEGESESSNSFNFQNTNNFKGPFPCVLRCFLRLRMSATGAVLIELCRVSTNSSLSSLACLAFLSRLTIEY